MDQYRMAWPPGDGMGEEGSLGGGEAFNGKPQGGAGFARQCFPGRPGFRMRFIAGTGGLGFAARWPEALRNLTARTMI